MVVGFLLPLPQSILVIKSVFLISLGTSDARESVIEHVYQDITICTIIIITFSVSNLDGNGTTVMGEIIHFSPPKPYTVLSGFIIDRYDLIRYTDNTQC